MNENVISLPFTVDTNGSGIYVYVNTNLITAEAVSYQLELFNLSAVELKKDGKQLPTLRSGFHLIPIYTALVFAVICDFDS